MPVMTFAQWVEQQEEELQAIQETLECDRLEAVKVLLLMRVSGDVFEGEEWEE